MEHYKASQPKRAAFLSAPCDPISLPNKSEPFANFTNKVMTGTIWTNKQKMRYKLADSEYCTRCVEDLEELFVDSHQHRLGLCKLSLDQHQVMWDELVKLWKTMGVTSIMFGPWFSVRRGQGAGWQLRPEFGDKGLIPKELRGRIKKYNTKLTNMDNIMKETKKLIRRGVLATFRAQWEV